MAQHPTGEIVATGQVSPSHIADEGLSLGVVRGAGDGAAITSLAQHHTGEIVATGQVREMVFVY